MKRILTLIVSIVLLALPIAANSAIPEERQLPLLVDDAGLLSDSEYSALLSALEDISERRECEVAVVTIQSLNGSSAESLADDIYDYYGFGYGPGDDGMLLLLAMSERKWHITTYGYGTVALTDYGIEQIGDEIVPYLSDGEYYSAFITFANLCDEYIASARAGSPVDVPKAKPSVLIALVIGLVAAFIATSAMKGQLKTVRSQGGAADYTVPGSLNVTEKRDMFLFRNVTKSPRPHDDGGSSGGGGSSTHTSSSGRSHGGGGGSF